MKNLSSKFLLIIPILIFLCSVGKLDAQTKTHTLKEIRVYQFPDRKPKNDKPYDPGKGKLGRFPDMFARVLFKGKPLPKKALTKTEKHSNATMNELDQSCNCIVLPFSNPVQLTERGTYNLKFIDDDDGNGGRNNETMTHIAFSPGDTKKVQGGWSIELLYE